MELINNLMLGFGGVLDRETRDRMFVGAALVGLLAQVLLLAGRVDAQAVGALLARVGLARARQTVEPGQRFLDFLGLETHRRQLAG